MVDGSEDAEEEAITSFFNFDKLLKFFVNCLGSMRSIEFEHRYSDILGCCNSTPKSLGTYSV